MGMYQFEDSRFEREARRDDDYFQGLYMKYAPQVYKVVRQWVRNLDDADDLTHEVFVRAYEYLQRNEPFYSPNAWLQRTARNLCVDFFRREQRKKKLSIDQLLESNADLFIDHQASFLEEEVVRQERIEVLRLAFSRLPQADKLLLRHGPSSRNNTQRMFAFARLRDEFLHILSTGEKISAGQPIVMEDSQQTVAPEILVDPNWFPAKLRPRYREVLFLYEVQGFSHTDLAQHFGIDEQHVRVLLHRARKRLEKLLEEQEQKRPSRRSRSLNEKNLQKLLSGDPFFQSHFPPPYAAVLRLAYGEGYTDQEIAAHLGAPLGTAKSRLTDAIAFLNSFCSNSTDQPSCSDESLQISTGGRNLHFSPPGERK